jgi:hypothetical protein
MLPRPLPRAPMVWLGIIGGVGVPFAVLDVWADLGEPDGDTFTECGRVVLDKIPYGWELFGLACVGLPAWFYRHMTKERRLVGTHWLHGHICKTP